jgi:hypothetical protein
MNSLAKVTRVAAVAVLLAVSPAQGELLKTEPKMGALREGQRVLVDNGKCPKGQVMEVIGGNHTKVGGTKKLERTRRCVAR